MRQRRRSRRMRAKLRHAPEPAFRLRVPVSESVAAHERETYHLPPHFVAICSQLSAGRRASTCVCPRATSPPSPTMTLPSRFLTLATLLFAAVACSDSTSSSSPFSGRWNGSNGLFSSVHLVVQQLGDSLTGTAETTLPDVHDGPRPLVGHAYGDSLWVEWFPSLTTGFGTIEFSGHRSGGTLVGSINSTQITLTKQ